MQMERKTIIKLLLGLAILSTLVLASGITNLQFSPAAPSDAIANPEEPVDAEPAQTVTGGDELTVLGIFFVGAAILSVIALFRGSKKELAVQLVMWTAIFAFYYLFVLSNQDFLTALSETNLNDQGPPANLFDGEGLEQVSPPENVENPPDWLTFLLALALIFAASVASFFTYRYVMKQRQKGTLERIAFEAEATLVKLHKNVNIRDAVTKCYYDMSQALSLERGISRAQGMTAREFENRLIETGLPRREVERLTRLFEDVRYGAQEPGERQKREAIACMNAIIQASQNAKKEGKNRQRPQTAIVS